MKIQALQIHPGHQWKAKPGHRILIINNGAVRFDFPTEWNLYSGSEYACLLDGSVGDYTCVLTVSAKQIPITVAGISFGLYLREIMQMDNPGDSYCTNPVRIFRPPLEAGWVEWRFIDPAQHREARKRVCIARAGCTRALITFDFWPEHELRHFYAWNTIVETLVVGDYIEDPLTGQRREKRG